MPSVSFFVQICNK